MTSVKYKPFARLSRRDCAVLSHVARNRLTTVEVLSHTVLQGLSSNGAAKILNRLCGAGYLQKYELVHPGKYYVLSDQGARLLGMSSHRTNSLGPQSLPTEYGVLAYANLGRQQRRRLTAGEVLQRCPGLTRSLAEATHCEDLTHGVLELVRVDLGGPADHVGRKCQRDMLRRYRFRSLAELLAQGRFRLVVITATSTKAAAIRRSFDGRDWPGSLLVHFSVIPQLLTLTARQSNA